MIRVSTMAELKYRVIKKAKILKVVKGGEYLKSCVIVYSIVSATDM